MFVMGPAMITLSPAMDRAKVQTFSCVILEINVIAIGITATMRNIVMTAQTKEALVKQGERKRS